VAKCGTMEPSVNGQGRDDIAHDRIATGEILGRPAGLEPAGEAGHLPIKPASNLLHRMFDKPDAPLSVAPIVIDGMWSDLLGENDIELPIIYSEHLTGDGKEMFEHAAKLNFEGVISKNSAAPYRSERTEAWLKIKAVQRGKFPVIAFVKDPTGVCRALPRQAGRQGPSLHEGRDGMVQDRLEPNS
jgi:hypothetical protein